MCDLCDIHHVYTECECYSMDYLDNYYLIHIKHKNTEDSLMNVYQRNDEKMPQS